MKYLCPSCKIQSSDDVKPLDMLTQPLCVFCSGKHSQKELINWQMHHLKEIDIKHHHEVIKHYYFYMDSKIKDIYSLIEDINRRLNGEKR